MMPRKVFWKSRRAIGTILATLALGLEASGFVPEGTTQSTVAAATAWLGVILAVWGGVQADTPLGFR